ncbi:MAG: methylmalonyl Co-A mutase-associated GTPase MeaB [Alphaproteobacteria bacterium]|nr:methylmalonyl Co-A mutase-associated GTPase MeaB [Alphaproteobacteria bacterium]
MAKASGPDPSAPNPLAEAVLGGDRRALARAITRIESTRADHHAEATAFLETVLPRTGRSVRLAISGVPGVGKSTFIEAFGLHIIGQGHRVAVLAVDPSSKRSGGSILGDKTRMEELARHPDAFIRPSPTGGTLGGVARRTREAMLACEAAGFDVIIVETVGVGQSETTVAEMVDMFLLLLHPGGGDDLQGIKRGIVELADLVLVNKADGEMKQVAGRTAADYKNALHLLHARSAHWQPQVKLCSAVTGEGIAEAWTTVEAYMTALSAAGEIEARRAEQAKSWMWNEVSDRLIAALDAHPQAQARRADLEARVRSGQMTPTAAAQALLESFLTGR